MPKEVTKYQCNFCTKSWVSKYRANEHENKCYRNPEVKSCWACGYRTENYCNLYFKTIFMRGLPVRDCEGWADETIDYADW